jgi:photosystem II stability/assembly factor-like uncharacterized protein
MSKGKEVIKYVVLGVICFSLISLLVVLRGGPTGYAIFGDSGSEFDNGVYSNVELNNSKILLTYYLESERELENNRGDDGYFDMTGNILLMHLNDTFLDYSGEGNSGTNNGVDFISGKLNNAGNFDGGDYIDTSLDLSGLEKFTISAWYYRSSTSDRFDISQCADNNQNRMKLIRHGSGLVYGVIQTGVTNSYATFSDNTIGWKHLVLVYDGTQADNVDKLRMYSDGQGQSLSFTGAIPSVIPSISNNLRIGHDIGSNTYSTGAMDEVSVWNRSLSSNEILELYQRQKSSYGKGQIGIYSSEIFNADGDASWNNLTWSSGIGGGSYLFLVDGAGDVYNSEEGVTWTQKIDNYGRTTATTDMFSNSNYIFILSNSGNEIWRGNGENFSVIYSGFGGNSPLVGESDSEGNLYVATGPGEIWKSTNDGVAWSLQGDANAGTNDPKGIAINSSDDLFLVDGAGDVYSSINDGVNWTLMTDNYGGGSSTNDLEIDSNDNLYILISKDIYKSTDEGVNWNKINDSFTEYSNNGMKMLIDSEDNCFISDAIGRIFKSIDGCVSWSEIGDGNNAASNDPKGLTSFRGQTNLDLFVRSCNDASCSGESWIDVADTSPLDLNLIDNSYFQYKFEFLTNDSLFSPFLETVDIDYTNLNVAPSLVLINPQDGASYGYNESLALDFIVSDADDNLDSCWYNLGGENITLASCANTTFDIAEGDHTLKVYANDSLGLEVSDSASFSVAVGAPSIVLNYPIDIYLNVEGNVIFNYTPIDVDLDSCELWGDFDGEFKLNQTDTSVTSGQINSFNLELVEGEYLWNVWCNDSQANAAFNGNKTFYIDITSPVLDLTNPTGEKTSRSNIPITFSVEDNSPTNCSYNLTNSVGVEIIGETDLEVCGDSSLNVPTDGDYIIYLRAIDSAGNLDLINSSFSVDSSAPVTPPSSGDSGSSSGGGSAVPINQSGKLEVSSVGDIIAHAGENEKVILTVKNVGRVFLNNCKLIITGEVSSWVYSDKLEGIAPGENFDFDFNISVPEEINAGDYSGVLEVKCDRGSSSQEINIGIPGLNEIKVIEVVQEGDILKINYDFDNTNVIGDSVLIDVWIVDEVGNEYQRIQDEFLINKEGFITRSIEIDVEDLIGIYYIYFAIASDDFDIEVDEFVKQSVVLGKSSTTGLAIFGQTKGKFISYISFVVIIFAGVAFTIIRHKKHVSKKEEKGKHKWLLRKKTQS